MGTVVLPESFASFRVADIPGIIEGAHEGAGLGDEFMRHIERSKVLVLVVDMGAEEGRDPVEDHATLLRELEARDPALSARPRIVVASKMDLPGAKERLREFRKATGVSPLETSVPEHRGFDRLVARLARLIRPEPRTSGRAPVGEEDVPVAGFGETVAPHRRRAKGAGAARRRAEKTGRETAPGHTPPRPIEGRGENPGAEDVLSARTQSLGSFLKR